MKADKYAALRRVQRESNKKGQRITKLLIKAIRASRQGAPK